MAYHFFWRGRDADIGNGVTTLTRVDADLGGVVHAHPDEIECRVPDHLSHCPLPTSPVAQTTR